jgi:hypothetical protein
MLIPILPIPLLLVEDGAAATPVADETMVMLIELIEDMSILCFEQL